jgi:outer membrane protein assembly factor BamD (BamD/ComL family)
VKYYLSLIAVVCFCTQPLQAAYLFKNGHLINAKDIATKTVEEHYQNGLDALKTHNWNQAASEFRIVTINFPDASLTCEAFYYYGVALYELGEYDLADSQLKEYLLKNSSAEHLEDVYRYKLSIADKFAQGCKRHMFNSSSFPSIMSAEDLAEELYTEVSIALPNHALAAQALLGKAKLFFNEENFSQAADVYQTTIRRFPISQQALTAYQGIALCYMEQIKRQLQNLDLITLAEINCAQCKRDFPQAQENTALETSLKEMKDLYAKALFETGQFYERTKQPKASALYYHLSLSSFPESSVASMAKERLKDLSPYIEELHLHTPKN